MNFVFKNACNIEIMSTIKDNYFDIAICDPAYGLKASKPSKKNTSVLQKNGARIKVKQSNYSPKDWDNEPPPEEYFKQVFRISKNQIIFGVNYFNFPMIGGRIIWDKLNGNSDQFGAEIAYNSFNNRTDIVYYLWAGMFQGVTASMNAKTALKQKGNKKENEIRIHPTQKPVLLYDFIFNKYLKNPGKIKMIDPNIGSFSSAIAAKNFGVSEFWGIEKDLEYFKEGKKRFLEHNQAKLFL